MMVDTDSSGLLDGNASVAGSASQAVSFGKGVPFVVLLSIVMVTNFVGLLGNILLIKVMHKSRSINQSYGFYLIALAITDSVNIMTRLIDSVEEILDYHYGKYILHRSSWSCRIYDLFCHIFTIVSAWLIVCISCERFLVMYFPLKGRVWWKSHYVTVFVSVFVVAVATQSPRLYFMERDAKDGYCRFKLVGQTFIIAVTFDSLVRFFFVYGIPGFTVLILNILIILRMYGFVKRSASLRMQEYRQRYPTAHLNNLNANSCSQGIYTVPADETPSVREKTRRDRKRATRILVTISCTYLFCMAPESIATFYWSLIVHKYDPALVPKYLDDMYIQHVYVYRFVYQIFTAISYGSNFYTYVAFGKRFRKEVSSVLRITSTSSSADANHHHAFQPENVPLKKCPAYGWHACGCPIGGDYVAQGRRYHNSDYQEMAPP